ncbi:stannin-like [Petromyzon marinus]|uniref:Stannin-like n=1 Tax=Petromyzon marinus TaxID=7757 RepID=A0AAJ7TSS0_PETMA|nr:stannin-like [Petromyzon marinus]
MLPMDHSPTTGVVTVIVILIAIAALGALICGCWCYLRLQRASCPSEDQESMVVEPGRYEGGLNAGGVGGGLGKGSSREPFLMVQMPAKGPCPERQAILISDQTGGGG